LFSFDYPDLAEHFDFYYNFSVLDCSIAIGLKKGYKMKSGKFGSIRIFFDKEADMDLILWLLGDRKLWEQSSKAAKRKLYELFYKEHPELAKQENITQRKTRHFKKHEETTDEALVQEAEQKRLEKYREY